MTWVERWVELFGGEPTDQTSGEVSVQDVVAELVAGQRAPWFQVFEPTAGGQDSHRRHQPKGKNQERPPKPFCSARTPHCSPAGASW